MRPVNLRRVVLLGSAILGVIPSLAVAQDTSAPVILQWFEDSWKTIDRRTADFHAAGYGSLWTPPPGRALYTDAGGGIGYDIYDRFDLGSPRDPTLYGTENQYRAVVRGIQKTGGGVYVDFVHHHVGSFDLFPGNSPGPYVQNRYDYPGFKLSNVGQEDGDTYKDPPNAPSGTPEFEYQYRLARLITLNFATNNAQFVRNPVPGFANNIPSAPNAWAIGTATVDANNRAVASTKTRQANLPSENNRRFYPDLNGPSRTVVDGGVSYTVYDYNTANPSAGDPTSETVTGYMMRYAQWLIQDIGLDGLRVDAARHVPLGAYHPTFNPNSVNIPRLIDRAVAGASRRTNLDGTSRSVFQFQEVFNGDPNFLQTFIRKSAAPGDTTNPNRDVLDFPMWFAMRNGLSANDSQNNWYNIRNASQDNRDDGLANNGSQSIGFVVNHDEGGVHLSNVAHAWILMRPGNAYVYFRGNGFDRSGNNSFFLKDGRGDALGGLYGNIITRLVDIRNSYGRGNFAERYIDGGGVSGDSKVYAFERVGSAMVGLSAFNNGNGVTSFDERTMYTAFNPGTRLIELTGNAADGSVDPLNQIPELIVVNNTDNPSLGNGRVTLRIPRNQNVLGVTHGKGYVIYGLPRPVGTLTIENKAFTIAGETPTPATNSTARLSSIDVVTANTFTVSLATNKVVLSDGFHDHRADGDMALLKINDGFDANGNGSPDYPSSSFANSTKYGFENFLTLNQPGYNPNPTNSGNGLYKQTVNAATLGEGYHYLTVRAWRNKGTNESEVFTDFRKTIYIDRLKPVSTVDSVPGMSGATDTTRDFRVRSLDQTADSVHVLLNLPASLTEPQILALVNGSNKADQIDRDLFGRINSNVPSGNHVATIVTYEITGNYNVQRIPGIAIQTTRGLGLGDVDHNNSYTVADITGVGAFEQVLYSQDTQFNPAADLDGNGRVNNLDLYALEPFYLSVGASAAVRNETRAAVLRRGNVNLDGFTNAADIDALYGLFGVFNWQADLNSNGIVGQGDVNTLVGTIFRTAFGDANLDGKVDKNDLAILRANLNKPGGWAKGDFTGDGFVTTADIDWYLSNFRFPLVPAVFPDPGSDFFGRAVPEPSAAGVVLMGAVALLRRRRHRVQPTRRRRVAA
jgi:hypothetical protein